MWASENMALDIFLTDHDHFSVMFDLEQTLKCMGNCLSKFNDKPFTLHTPQSVAGHIKKVASGIRKNPVKCFESGKHRNCGYERFTQSIKSSRIDVYHRFPLQSFELLDGGTQVIKSLVIKK